MNHIPDSPEGVALALLMFILGAVEPIAPRDPDEVLGLYRRCLATVQDTETGRTLLDLREVVRNH